MMKMIMKIQKTQVVSVDRFVGGSGVVRNLRRTASIQAGFKQVDAMCIGGRGGANSQAAANYWGSGGGGGGSIKGRALLKDLNELTPYFSGVAGQHGDAGGFDGQSSYFGSWQAYGGKGASGISQGWGTPDVYASIGGEGGGNSVNSLEGGNGGHPAFSWGGLGYAKTGPENGPWTDQGGGFGHGGGGGGGGGRSNRAGYVSATTGGGYGAVSGAQCPPVNGYDPSYYGGMGGGANLGLISGVTEYYGVNAVAPGYVAEGVVYFVLS